MNENFQIALQLLGVGMLTVFAILFLVIFIGNMIIRFVNRFVGEEATVHVVEERSQPVIDPKKAAAIVSAVQIVTKGKGKVVKIEKC